MNKIQVVQVNYINFGCRTLETILLTNESKEQKIVYLYNYEGNHFRIFENFFEASNFFNDKPFKILKEYKIERFADRFLENYSFIF